jgi:long-chain acyl-CoA synthetase
MAYVPRYTNLAAMFSEQMEKHRDKPLFGTRGPADWEWLSYGQFNELVAAARSGLAQLGIQAGDRVAVISNNRVEWAVCAYATYTHGAVYVPMYEAQLDKDWHFILQDSGAKACLVAGAHVEQRVRALQPTLSGLTHVINFDDDSYQQLLQRGRKQPSPAARPDDHAIATLIYTSGTTGAPKGVMLTHANIATNVSGSLEVAPVVTGDRSLAFLPWAHVLGGCLELNVIMNLGGSLAICDNTDRLLGYLPEVKPTVLVAVPRIWNRIYDGVQKQMAARPKPLQLLFRTAMRAQSRRRRGERLGVVEQLAVLLAERLIFAKVVARFGGRLRAALSGAAALSPDVAEFIDNLGINVFEGYGMTECSGCATVTTAGARKIGTVGKPVPGVTLEIDEHAPGAQAGEGEIIIYGGGVMAGYYNQPEATRAAKTADGGLRSGDLGRIDGDGLLVITGRVKELYKLQNGKYVAPAPMEEKLQLSPFIAQCVVYGSDQPYNVALIVPDMVALRAWAQAEGVPSDADVLLRDPRTRALFEREIKSYGSEFKGYESIRDFVLSAEELSTANDMMTPTLKLKRRNVMAAYEPRLKALYRGAAA